MTTMEPTSSVNLTEQVAELLERTRTALESDERAFALSPHLPALDDSPLRIAVGGPHNAGKSMLIAALLGLPRDQVEAMTGAVPLTDAITPYNWSGHTLLDLPGTLSGLDAHDAVAALGVRRADLLLLVTSVELPGEAETEQIRHLLAAEGFARRVLVVLNKCNSEDNDLHLVRAEMLDRLSPFPWIEPHFADAKDEVDARNADGLTDEDRELLRADSRVEAVASALNLLAVEQGSTARLLSVCHEVRRISTEAFERWAPDAEEEAREIIAARIRAAIADARRELTVATDLALGTLADQIEAAGNRLASAVSEEDASLDERSVATADQDEVRAAEQYEAALNRAVDDVLARLDKQLDTTLDDWERYSPDLEPGTPRTGRRRPRKKPRLLVDEAGKQIWDAAQQKLREFVEGGVREGSEAHDLAKWLKTARGGGRAKPWEHTNRARGLTKAGERVGDAAAFVAPLVDMKAFIDDVRAAQAVGKRRAAILSQYSVHLTETMKQERTGAEAFIGARLARRHDAVAAIVGDADGTIQARTEAQEQWRTQEQQATALAALLDEVLAR